MAAPNGKLCCLVVVVGRLFQFNSILFDPSTSHEANHEDCLLNDQFASLVNGVDLLFCEKKTRSFSYHRDTAMRTSKRRLLDTSGGASRSPFLMWLVIDKEAIQETTSCNNCRGFSVIHAVPN